ncbi:MAG: 16S rRNA (guanine(966)-N(2))-methyltransferase RsmD [Syntrophaceae bacterium]|nr:16S rRNA (guanine(966)-N(2))-methyltransferase RsmD [Syntrophaceae bacterium]
MRISGGEAKGRTLSFPARSIQRPTTDFLREAIFNLLGAQSGRTFLDVFAGSGSVGIEALSRGARAAAFVEKSKMLATVIRENLCRCGYAEKGRIITADFQSALRDLYKKNCRYDVIFADPPYNEGYIERILRALEAYPSFTPEGVLVLQHSAREAATNTGVGWSIEDQRKYGDNLLTFLKVVVA